jgi:Capsule polysaccharide export protein
MSDAEKKISLLDVLIIVLEKKTTFIISMLVFCCAGVTISLLATKYYAASAVIMKPAQKMSPALGSLLGKDLPVSGLLKSMDLFGSNDLDQFLGVLNSRRLAEKTIVQFNLAHHYGFDKNKMFYLEDVVRTFQKTTHISEDHFGNIEISVTDTSPEMAADLANYMVVQLDSIMYILSKESAKNSRMFFAERLGIIKTDLDSASRAFTNFQIQNNYINLDAQVKSTIEALAGLEAQKIAVEMEMEQIKNQFGQNNQRELELQKNKSVIQKQIKYYMDAGGGNLMVSLKNAPTAATTYGELMRNVRMQETLYEFALQMVEQAKFIEANNTPAVQVLEFAQPPHKKSRPKRAMICMFFFIAGFIITVTGILSLKWFSLQRETQTDMYKKISYLFSLLKFRK